MSEGGLAVNSGVRVGDESERERQREREREGGREGGREGQQMGEVDRERVTGGEREHTRAQERDIERQRDI